MKKKINRGQFLVALDRAFWHHFVVEDRQRDPELCHVVSQHDGNVRVFDWRIKFVERNETVADGKEDGADGAEDFWKILNVLDARIRPPDHCDEKAAVDGNAVD